MGVMYQAHPSRSAYSMAIFEQVVSAMEEPVSADQAICSYVALCDWVMIPHVHCSGSGLGRLRQASCDSVVLI